MNAEQKKAAVRRYYDEAWSQGRFGVVDELFAPEYKNCDPATPGYTVQGREAFKTLLGSYRQAFPDLHMRIDEQLCDGETVITR
ncbi:MAG: ester cyclase, partial [Polyangiales bacterium]